MHDEEADVDDDGELMDEEAEDADSSMSKSHRKNRHGKGHNENHRGQKNNNEETNEENSSLDKRQNASSRLNPGTYSPIS